ncbi:Predicted metal-binding protein [Sporobacter termitidis DSM 10068]|uniref:Predicted metal-binding protein n=1 Tax=Sporobacter termitidis DSM 10068 TaxID=1123282 RepID=A0A1M5XU15_9FIRM|nr:DUF2284 domain-containing protein [Sporobacter termitidis]SHI02743.1 Predicted metal-binding protein [Sporobacter termitidis DSM 10068]
MSETENRIIREIAGLGVYDYAFIKSDQVVFTDVFRRLCEENSCGMYNKSWACPPAVGTVEACKGKCLAFENAFVFTSVSELEDVYDVEEWLKFRVIHEAMTEKVVGVFRREFENVLPLSTEGCTVCKTCAYPDKPCRFPDRMFPAVEGYGIAVTQLAKAGGLSYNNGPGTLTYFSAIFF